LLHAVNANIAMVTGFSVHPDAEEAKRRGEDGFKFFGYALAHHYIFAEHRPGRTDIWAAYEKARAKLPEAGAARGIGTPDQLRAHLKSFECSGVDQVAFIQQGVRTNTIIHTGAGGGAPADVGRGTNTTRKSGEGLSGRISCVSLFASILATRCEHLPALDVDWTYQLAGSLLRPRKTNVCRQSG
jgi:hypothetical protein